MISIYRWRRDIDEWRLFSVATLLFFRNLWTKIQASSSFSVVSGGGLDGTHPFSALWCSPLRLGAADAATLSLSPCYNLEEPIFSPKSREHVFPENVDTRNRFHLRARTIRGLTFSNNTEWTADITRGDKEIVSRRERLDGVKATRRVLEGWRGRRRQREKRRSQARRKSKRRRRNDEMAEL